MSQDCLFCKFVSKEIPTKIAYEDEKVLAFHDINPQAPTHVLVIPKKHYDSAMEVPEGDAIVTTLTEGAKKVAEKLGIAKDGFRLVVNTRQNGGQTVNHLHMHLLGGRFMTWPPG
jgi:histidine triad (HIT) family protein